MTRRLPLVDAVAQLIHTRQLGCPEAVATHPPGWVTDAAEDITWAILQHLDGTQHLDDIAHTLKHAGESA